MIYLCHGNLLIESGKQWLPSRSNPYCWALLGRPPNGEVPALAASAVGVSTLCPSHGRGAWNGGSTTSMAVAPVGAAAAAAAAEDRGGSNSARYSATLSKSTTVLFHLPYPPGVAPGPMAPRQILSC
eukprot:1136297-Pelagomonas_calceolata.AAC.1